MSTKIKGAEYPLSKIFSSNFDYVTQLSQHKLPIKVLI